MCVCGLHVLKYQCTVCFDNPDGGGGGWLIISCANNLLNREWEMNPTKTKKYDSKLHVKHVITSSFAGVYTPPPQRRRVTFRPNGIQGQDEMIF